MEKLLKGKIVADALDEKTLVRVGKLKEKGLVPKLAIVRVGENESDLSYERGALKRCDKLGIEVEKHVLDMSCSQEELIDVIHSLNDDKSVHGVLMFRPLPKSFDEDVVCNELIAKKDVDGITRGSNAYIYSSKGSGFEPCTAGAVIDILKHYDIDIAGKKVVVVGRSLVIGKPVSMLFLNENATVTICHSKTKDMKEITKSADIVVAAIGKAEFLDDEFFSENQIIIDVGINYSDEKKKLVGDVNFENMEGKAIAITPVPGGVGSVTTAELAKHVVMAAENLTK